MTQDRLHVKGMFVSKYVGPVSGKACRAYDISIISDDDGYIEYTLSAMDESRGLTKNMQDKLRKMFGCYLIDETTRVCVLDTIPDGSPLLIWIRTLAMQAGFLIHRRTMEQVLRRISYECHTYVQEKKKNGVRRDILKTKDVGMRNILAIWRKLCRTRRCPWITVELDQYIRKHCDHEAVRRRQYVRLGALYLAFVAYRRKHKLRFNARLRAGLVGTPELQEAARRDWAERHPEETMAPTDVEVEDISGTIMAP